MKQEPGAPALPPELAGVVEADYQQWRHHQVTKVYLQYLKDFREGLRNQLLDLLEAGQLDEQLKHEAKGRLSALNECVFLEYAHMVRFYQAASQTEQDSGAEATEDDGY